MRLFTPVLALAVLASVPVLAVSPMPRSSFAPSDVAIARQALADGNTEVELGRLASERARSLAVKQFGELTMQDHGKVNLELTALLRTRGSDVPTTSSLDEHGQSVRGHLATLRGDAFDAAFMEHMREEHRKAEIFYTHAQTSARDPALKKEAARALSVVREHRKLIDNIAPEPG